MSGPFIMLPFPRSGNGQVTEQSTVYVEGFTGACTRKVREIDRYAAAFTNIWKSYLDETASRQLIPRAARE